MTPDEFRKLALGFPETSEQSHMDHPDFRVGKKIFATLGPDEEWGMVKLTPQQQASFVRTEPDAFEPFAGAWGKRGCTKICLEPARKTTVRKALTAAWRNTAPKRLVKEYEGEED